MKHTVLRFVYALICIVGLQLMQTEDTFAADCWVYSNETTNWFVQDETIQWRRDGLDCRVNVKTASKDPNNTAKTKIHHKHYSYYNGAWYVVYTKFEPMPVDHDPIEQAIFNFLFNNR